MGREFVEPEAFESMRALLEATNGEDYAGVSKVGEKFEKANFTWKVVEYEEQDDDDGEWVGETFTDGAYYKNGGVPPRGKLPNLITAAKGDDYFEKLKKGKVTFDPTDMVGSRVRAQVEVNDAGYSTIVWNTISSVAPKRRARKAQKKVEDEIAAGMKAAEDGESEELAKDENNPLFEGDSDAA